MEAKKEALDTKRKANEQVKAESSVEAAAIEAFDAANREERYEELIEQEEILREKNA